MKDKLLYVLIVFLISVSSSCAEHTEDELPVQLSRPYYLTWEYQDPVLIISWPKAIGDAFLLQISQHEEFLESHASTREYIVINTEFSKTISDIDFVPGSRWYARVKAVSYTQGVNDSEFTAVQTIDIPEEKTFQVLLDKALYLKKSRNRYVAFKDYEINIVKVTNLNAEGEHSLSWAIEQEGSKIIVFEVGGVIDLDGRTLIVNKPYTYVAGQTAPNPGITFIKGSLSIRTHDVVVEHIASRPGDRGLPKAYGWEVDALGTTTKTWEPTPPYNILVDQCSFTWGTDENLSVEGEYFLGPENTSHCVTYSNNLIAEGLYDSTHPKGPHSMGTLVANDCRDIALVGNLYAHNWDRNPALKPKAVAYIANNFLYNVQIGIMAYWVLEEYADYPGMMAPAQATVIGNVMIPGMNTPAHRLMIHGGASEGTPADMKTFIVYNLDNQVLDGDNGMINGRVQEVLQKPTDTDNYTPLPFSLLYDNLLKNVGARPKERDKIDSRIVQSVHDRSGRIIDSQDEVGGYPAYTQTTRTLQVPTTNIEAWLANMAKELLNL